MPLDLRLCHLNTPAIANSGATLATACTAALGAEITTLCSGTRLPLAAMIAPFVGLVVGVALAYLGQPSTLPTDKGSTP